jgi:hypothetical protein
MCKFVVVAFVEMINKYKIRNSLFAPLSLYIFDEKGIFVVSSKV